MNKSCPYNVYYIGKRKNKNNSSVLIKKVAFWPKKAQYPTAIKTLLLYSKMKRQFTYKVRAYIMDPEALLISEEVSIRFQIYSREDHCFFRNELSSWKENITWLLPEYHEEKIIHFPYISNPKLSSHCTIQAHYMLSKFMKWVHTVCLRTKHWWSRVILTSWTGYMLHSTYDQENRVRHCRLWFLMIVVPQNFV